METGQCGHHIARVQSLVVLELGLDHVRVPIHVHEMEALTALDLTRSKLTAI